MKILTSIFLGLITIVSFASTNTVFYRTDTKNLVYGAGGATIVNTLNVTSTLDYARRDITNTFNGSNIFSNNVTVVGNDGNTVATFQNNHAAPNAVVDFVGTNTILRLRPQGTVSKFSGLGVYSDTLDDWLWYMVFDPDGEGSQTFGFWDCINNRFPFRILVGGEVQMLVVTNMAALYVTNINMRVVDVFPANVAGRLVYHSVSNKMYCADGSIWNPLW